MCCLLDPSGCPAVSLDLEWLSGQQLRVQLFFGILGEVPSLELPTPILLRANCSINLATSPLVQYLSVVTINNQILYFS